MVEKRIPLRSLEVERRDAAPERDKVLTKALLMANELAEYCHANNVGRFDTPLGKFERLGSVMYIPLEDSILRTGTK